MSTMRLLLIEDNERLGQLIRDGLTKNGLAVDWQQTLEDGEATLEAAAFDLLLLDLGLPDGDGLDLIRRLRRASDTIPILVLTARGGLRDRITGLDAGADDYLIKPFDISELSARCRALLRRPVQGLTPVLSVGKLTFDTSSRQAAYDGAQIELSRREAGLLEVLMRRAGAVLTKQALEDAVYDFNEPVTPNAVEVGISRLRRKLDDAGAKDLLHNVRGVGYIVKAKRA
jgi:two-component system response regulator QseB